MLTALAATHVLTQAGNAAVGAVMVAGEDGPMADAEVASKLAGMCVADVTIEAAAVIVAADVDTVVDVHAMVAAIAGGIAAVMVDSAAVAAAVGAAVGVVAAAASTQGAVGCWCNGMCSTEARGVVCTMYAVGHDVACAYVVTMQGVGGPVAILEAACAGRNATLGRVWDAGWAGAACGDGSP